jgi:hypothetical protein
MFLFPPEYPGRPLKSLRKWRRNTYPQGERPLPAHRTSHITLPEKL